MINVSPRSPSLILVIALALGAAGCAPDNVDEPAGAAPERVSTLATSSPHGTSVEVEIHEESSVGEPARIVIDDIGVSADLVGVGLADDGSMETPAYDSNLAGWYTEGPRPGEAGPAVIAAHVDHPGGGPDTFARLDELDPGDEIVVFDIAGERYEWIVDRVEQHDKDALPVDEIWRDVDHPALTLITCAGDYEVDEYADNLIVYTDYEEEES